MGTVTAREIKEPKNLPQINSDWISCGKMSKI